MIMFSSNDDYVNEVFELNFFSARIDKYDEILYNYIRKKCSEVSEKCISKILK